MESLKLAENTILTAYRHIYKYYDYDNGEKHFLHFLWLSRMCLRTPIFGNQTKRSSFFLL